MKRIFFFTAISATLLFASCSNEDMGDITPEIKTYTPKAEATIGQLTDANPQPTTRAGVVEDNPDYALGEKFYWHNGDKAKVLFFADGDLNSTPVELIYTATVADGVQSKTCQYSTSGSVPAGNYAVYALYPADGWSKDATGYKATMSSWIVMQTDLTSSHLRHDMFMKADAGNITISGTGDNSLNLSFKHLSAVVRFHITDNVKPTSLSFELFQLIMYDFNIYDYVNFFPTEAYLA